jgi:hypothetical protein
MDKSMFLKHIGEFEFQDGLDKEMWGFQFEDPTSTWPDVFIWTQTPAKYYALGKCYLRFNLDGYPVTAPAACPWDTASNDILAPGEWPKGATAIDKVFNPNWRNFALYAPFDRVPLSDHPDWPTKYPEYCWRKTFKITDYLLFIHSLLNQP